MKNSNDNSPNGGNVQHTLEEGVEKATKAAHSTIDSFSEAARPAIAHMASSAHSAADRARATANHAAEALGEKGDKLNESSKKIIAQTEGYVREHPVASLGIAVAAGYILNRLFSSR
jgi:ElaB/YqjD/DUF883 family membrane-anchored ribosome-binding protein